MSWLYPHSTLQIESTRRCNLNCPICMRQNLDETQALLSLEDFKKALDSWDFQHVALHGWGEPLLNPEIFQMIEYAKLQGISTELTTNATLLKKNIENILTSGLSVIVFGISNKEILPFILPQIEELIKMRNENRLRNPRAFIDIVIYKGNLNQILDLVKITSQLNIEGVVLHRLFKVDPGVKYISIQEEKELFREAADLAKVLKVKLYLPPQASLPCEAVRQSIFVTAEGKITPCPFLSQLYIGEVHNGGVKGAIYSAKYINFIKNIEGHPICNKCPLGFLTQEAFTPLEIQSKSNSLRSPKGDLSLTGFIPKRLNSKIWPEFQQEEENKYLINCRL